MRCFHPLTAARLDDGSITFRDDLVPSGRELQLRCGRCIGCRIQRSQGWAVRCMHEASLYKASSFVTFTYDERRLESLSLRYKDFQAFCKKARRKIGPFRFYVAGEYTKRWHPHWHAILFGVGFEDRYPWRNSPSGFQLYRSKVLEELWPHGNCEIGDVSLESAGYVAQYAMKKVSGQRAADHYLRVDDRTGEIVALEPELSRMSLRPGIGARWFEKYKSDVFPRDHVRVGNRKLPVPRYYDQLLDRVDEYCAIEVETLRQLRSIEGEKVVGPSLESQELVAKAKYSLRERF